MATKVNPSFSLIQRSESSRTSSSSSMGNGKYRILERLGEGGFALVWKVEERSTGNVYAAKELKFSHSVNTYVVQRFRTEAACLKTFSSQCSVPELHDFFFDNVPVMIEEYINGQSLENLYSTSEYQFTEDTLIDFLKEIAAILEVVHNSNVVHRDIKPDNILKHNVTGKLYLIDFGIARDVPPVAVTQTVVGTVGFMPPEALVGKTTNQSDLYSLGVTAFVLFLKTLPKADCLEIASKLAEQAAAGESMSNLAVLNACADKLPRTQHILRKMTALDLTVRYASVAALQQDLANI